MSAKAKRQFNQLLLGVLSLAVVGVFGFCVLDAPRAATAYYFASSVDYSGAWTCSGGGCTDLNSVTDTTAAGAWLWPIDLDIKYSPPPGVRWNDAYATDASSRFIKTTIVSKIKYLLDSVQNAPPEGSAINSVELISIGSAKKDNLTDNVIWVYTTTNDSMSMHQLSLTTGWQHFDSTFNEPPQGGLWDEDDLDSLAIAVEVETLGSKDESYVTFFVLAVDFTAPASDGQVIIIGANDEEDLGHFHFRYFFANPAWDQL